MAAAPRVRQCPVQLESLVEAVHGIVDDDVHLRGRVPNIEVRVVRVHLDAAVVMYGFPEPR